MEKTSPEQREAIGAFKQAVLARKNGEDISTERIRELAKAAGVERFLDESQLPKVGDSAEKLRRQNATDLEKTVDKQPKEVEVAETLPEPADESQDVPAAEAPKPKKKKASEISEPKKSKESLEPVEPKKPKSKKTEEPVEPVKPKKTKEPAETPKTGKRSKEPAVTEEPPAKKKRKQDAEEGKGGSKPSGSKPKARQLTLHDMKTAVWTTRSRQSEEKAAKQKKGVGQTMSEP